MASVSPTAHPQRSYAIRLSYAWTDIPEMFWQAITRLTEGVFAAAHDDIEDNKHVHLAAWNVSMTHDAFRKKIKHMVELFIDENPPEGNALMSVKKWDGKEKYLIYMLKGDRHEVAHNSIPLESSYIEYLRKQWSDGESDQKKAYNEWKASPHWPAPIMRTVQEMLEDKSKNLSLSTTPPFDTIKEKALEFSLARYGGFVNAKVRYEVKDLISNYCLFNKIKMSPVYI